MKNCPSCDRQCYDTELFCPDCGTAMPVALKCTYCSAPVLNLSAKHCSECGGVLAFDRYPANKGTIHCTACGQKRPVTSKYCTACGIKHENPGRKAKLAGLKRFFVGFGIFAFAIVMLNIVGGIIYSTIDLPSDPIDMNDEVRIEALKENAPTDSSGYILIDMNEFGDIKSDLKKKDYIEVTGSVGERSSYYCELIPSDLTANNKEWCIYINWTYDDENGIYINDYVRVGDVITVRCAVTETYDYSNTIYACGIDFVE